MKNLISFEIRKLFQARVLYVCAGVLVLLVLMFAGINKLQEVVVEEAMSGLAVGDETIAISTSDDMPDSLAALMGMSSRHSGVNDMLQALTNVYIVIVFAAFVAVFFCGDYGNGTIKNVFTKGYTRTEVFFSKYLVCLAVSLCYALLAMLTGFLCGLLMWDVGKEWGGKAALLVLLQLLTVAGYNALFCFLAAVFKRVGSTLAMSLALPIALPLILTLIDLFAGLGSGGTSQYWLAGCISLVSSVQATAADMTRCAICSGLYCILFTVGGWFFHRKREV